MKSKLFKILFFTMALKEGIKLGIKNGCIVEEVIFLLKLSKQTIEYIESVSDDEFEKYVKQLEKRSKRIVFGIRGRE